MLTSAFGLAVSTSDAFAQGAVLPQDGGVMRGVPTGREGVGTQDRGRSNPAIHAAPSGKDGDATSQGPDGTAGRN